MARAEDLMKYIKANNIPVNWKMVRSEVQGNVLAIRRMNITVNPYICGGSMRRFLDIKAPEL